MVKNSFASILDFIMPGALKYTGADSAPSRYLSEPSFCREFEHEGARALEAYRHLRERNGAGAKPVAFKIGFISDKHSNLVALRSFLASVLAFRMAEPEQRNCSTWVLNGISAPVPMTESNLVCWALHLYQRGFEFDARFDTYESIIDADSTLPWAANELENDALFDLAVDLFIAGDIAASIFAWSELLVRQPEDAEIYFCLGRAKSQLKLWKAALEDYTKAIELNVDYCEARINRGVLLDELGDHRAAIEDFDHALTCTTDNSEIMAKLLFNLGNAYHRLGDVEAARQYWSRAQHMGAHYAQANIEKYW